MEIALNEYCLQQKDAVHALALARRSEATTACPGEVGLLSERDRLGNEILVLTGH